MLWGTDHRDVAAALSNLASVLRDSARYEEADELYEQAIDMSRRIHGDQHVDVARRQTNLADLRMLQDRNQEAMQLYEQALPIFERAYGADHPFLTKILGQLAQVHFLQGNIKQARSLIDRAIELAEHGGGSESQRRWSYTLRARIALAESNRDAAMRDLEQALELAEVTRQQASGGERERAEYFGKSLATFELMLSLQVKAGDVSAAHATVERSLARSLIDLMETQGADLLAGMPVEDAEVLRQRELVARAELARLQFEIEQLERPAAPTIDSDRSQQRLGLLVELAQARDEAAATYRDICNRSPALRTATGAAFRACPLSDLQQWVDQEQALLVQFFLGEQSGYRFILSPGTAARVESLELDPSLASAVAPPDLVSRDTIASVLNVRGQPLLSRLANDDIDAEVIERLHQLWNWLIPQSERVAIIDGRYRRLVVIPTGSLARLPFEVLVVKPAVDPDYLLDIGLPVAYAPSATVLRHLTLARQATSAAGPLSILTVGDPNYAGAMPSPISSAKQSDIEESTPAPSRYSALGGRLSRLPYSGTESKWVAEIFGQHQVEVVQLLQDQATESNVRRRAAGQIVVHLASHGLVDQQYGNLFGAIALAPGSRQAFNPDDDGLLSMREIYELNLRQCKLAILSACQTNHGPDQLGEGAWSLSRAFLVAGSQHVVGSNWVVDDEATASLIAAYCRQLAGPLAEGQQVDQAAALAQSKRWIRQQTRWRSPFYWGGFVLLGPP